MDGRYIGRHKGCGLVMERERNRGKFGTKSFHWICDQCGKEPDSGDIKPAHPIES